MSGLYELPEWCGPSSFLVEALGRVQADLDAAGLGRFALDFAVAGGTDGSPIVNVHWGGTWTGDSIGIDVQDAEEATVDVASQAAQGLVELEGIYLPSCPAHAVRARAFLDHRRRAVWRCDVRGHTPHALSDIGSLAEIPRKIARKGPLWRGLNPPPA